MTFRELGVTKESVMRGVEESLGIKGKLEQVHSSGGAPLDQVTVEEAVQAWGIQYQKAGNH